MAFIDTVKGDGWSLGTALFGTLGDGLGFASASTDGKTSDGLGVASGAAGALSGLGGILASFGKLHSTRADDRQDGGWDFAENAFSTAVGVADVATGSYGIQAADAENEEDAKKYMKNKGIAQMVSGSLGLLGGTVSSVRGALDWWRARRDGSPEGKQKRLDAGLGILGGLGKIANGVGNIYQGRYTRDDPLAEDSALNGKRSFWGNYRKLATGFGMLPGAINSYRAARKLTEAGHAEAEMQAEQPERIEEEMQEEQPERIDEEMQEEQPERIDAEMQEEQPERIDEEMQEEQPERIDAEMQEEQPERIDAEMQEEQPERIDEEIHAGPPKTNQQRDDRRSRKVLRAAGSTVIGRTMGVSRRQTGVFPVSDGNKMWLGSTGGYTQ